MIWSSQQPRTKPSVRAARPMRQLQRQSVSKPPGDVSSEQRIAVMNVVIASGALTVYCACLRQDREASRREYETDDAWKPAHLVG